MTAVASSFRIDAESGIVLLQNQGSLTYEDWRAAVDAAETAGRLRLVLSDRRRLVPVYPPGLVKGVTSYILSHQAELDGVRWALLMGDPAAAHTAANAAMQVIESGLEIKIFTDARAALAWLLSVYTEADLFRLERWVEGRDRSEDPGWAADLRR